MKLPERIPEIECDIFDRMYLASVFHNLDEVARGQAMVAKKLGEYHEISDGILIDVGCATGILARALARRFSNSRVIGIDKSRTMISFANALNKDVSNLEFKLKDLYALNGENADMVICSDMLHHTENVQGAFSAINRALKPGGILFLNDLNRENLNLLPHQFYNDFIRIRKSMSDACALVLFHEMGFFDNPETIRDFASFMSFFAAYTPYEARRGLVKNGFRIEEERIENFKYGFYARKI